MTDRPMTPREQNVWDMAFAVHFYGDELLAPHVLADGTVEAYRAHLAEHAPEEKPVTEPELAPCPVAAEAWQQGVWAGARAQEDANEYPDELVNPYKAST